MENTTQSKAESLGMRLISLYNPAMLAVAPAIGYLIAYLDRLGEAFVYGIPVEYISLSVTDVLSRTSIVVVALVLFIAFKQIEIALATRLPRWVREPSLPI